MDTNSLHQTAVATKEAVEVMMGQRGSALDAGVTWGDLVDLGLITEDQIPRDVGQSRR
jgi:hypothetical protein